MAHCSSDSLAYLSSFAAQLIFPLAQIFVVQNNFTVYEICYMRSTLIILFSLAVAKYKDIALDLTIKRNFGLLLVKNVFSCSWIFMMTLSYYYLSFANIFSINVCGALFVFLWDSYLFNMTFNNFQKLGVFLGISGSILIINANILMKAIFPDFIWKSDFKNYKSTQTIHIAICSTFLLISNILFAYSNSITKKIKIQKDACQINFHFGIVMGIFSAIGWILTPEKEPKEATIYCWAALLTSLPQTIASQLAAIALVMTKNSGIVSLFMTVSVIVSYSIDTLRYNLTFNPIALIGSLLIISGITLTILKKSAEPKKQASFEQIMDQS